MQIVLANGLDQLQQSVPAKGAGCDYGHGLKLKKCGFMNSFSNLFILKNH